MNPKTVVSKAPRDGVCVPAPSQSSGAVRKWKILVADDEDGIRCFASYALSFTGFDVDVVSDGEQAWDALTRGHYDLLITDHDMPRLTGMKLIERIRETGMRLPVILASGSLATACAPDHPQLRISAVLSKPFTISELMKAVRLVLSSSYGEDGGRELRGGPPSEPAAASHWSSVFRHEATFPGAPLSVGVPQLIASKEVHNRILIADDDALVRGSLAAVLESESFVVDEAQDGVEAVTRAIEHTPDLILLDLNMPRWDGWTAFSQLDRVTPLLPVIVITARPNQYTKAVKLGVDAFMEKPLNIPILVRAITRLTSEDKKRHERRITNRAFVTQLLNSAGS
jgi:DNA-binding response OmpR family regulator